MHIADSRDRVVAYRYFQPFVQRFRTCKAVLDIASGQGYFLEMLRGAGITGTGIELDAALCAQAREKGLHVINADFFTFLKQVKVGEYDGCFASHIVEHFFPARVEEMFGLLAQAMPPGALFIVVTPNIANIRRAVGDFWRDPTHVRPYPISALSKLLRRNRWEVIDSGECTSRPPSLRRTLAYAIRNLLFGRYWVGDDIYVVARRSSVSSPPEGATGG